MPVDTDGSVRSMVHGSFGPENAAVVASGMFHGEVAENGQNTGSREVGKEDWAAAFCCPASNANVLASTRPTDVYSICMKGRLMIRSLLARFRPELYHYFREKGKLV